jgi:hypothetical protein
MNFQTGQSAAKNQAIDIIPHIAVMDLEMKSLTLGCLSSLISFTM